MACDWFERRWQRLLDERLEPADDDQLAEHARQCDDCGQWLEAQQCLFDSIERWAATARRAGRASCRCGMTSRCGTKGQGVERRARSWPVFVVPAMATLAAIVLAGILSMPEAPPAGSRPLRSPSGWRVVVADWSAASGRWLAANVTPVNASATVRNDANNAGRSAPAVKAKAAKADKVGFVEVSAWEFHWVARVGYSLAATETPPVERMEGFAGTIRPLATSVYRVVETLRPKWQSVAPPATPERQRSWDRLDMGPSEPGSGESERNSSWRVSGAWVA